MEPFLRIVVVHPDGTEAIYHVRRIEINEAITLSSNGYGTTIIEPPKKEV